MKNSFKILSVILAFALFFTFVGCSNNKNETDDEYVAEKIGIVKAKINIAGYGSIYLELDGDTAPITVANFKKLVEEKFYDGLTFHRIISDFMIQGGDPEADGTGGSEETIRGEFSSNGIENSISHVRGTISMARYPNDPNSASSQFFIVQKDSPHLDGDYAAFGKVTEGMDIVDKIATQTPVADSYSGLVAQDNQPCISSIEIIE